ncbi:mediator of RNA polymerase II transcription subunit 7 isoform X1 [Dromiciops gliroides]|uniref:mediator of RNA polymerase II transcription subunit 7 isoform X1 n=2 Tax=Dromiciops gliroides TaxID=33562 RepID=UPI001CC3CB62|nr:mediator of RNA polymerase II transcription subunit 7 isoform X1 [Dromiciops gliroides]XP_043844712.1 mediator of RNA polymerase II transcription subunit 7 isoform X1 [Dromiciops gliroides]XP_043844713.1 mediator of RNA polymerase II transcription subunit 7 isoform X1 [Dromiciops gliroides]XP_043844714.1 mediator of RNA polymerase II transcription subunit 7 isoform X1 [Dromiciops gliroides]XP_043844715.1 mediator of RNA polymerase II transcription subunit 7 isoform X1 [Dromiciops gliroides]
MVLEKLQASVKQCPPVNIGTKPKQAASSKVQQHPVKTSSSPRSVEGAQKRTDQHAFGEVLGSFKMGEPQQVSALPPPPMQYIKEYTDENIRKGLAPKPPPPIKDSYMMFGNQFQCDDLIIRPLESQGIERLHPMQFDHKKELRKLNMSILINFLDLLDILIRSPGSIKREEKLEDLKLLFVHVHHLINEYRPHQARETLRVMMEVQKRQRLETAERFQKHLERVIEMIQNCLASLPDDLPHTEGGMRLKTEPMDTDDSKNCVGQNEHRENSSHRRDQIIEKDAALCILIDEMNERP